MQLLFYFFEEKKKKKKKEKKGPAGSATLEKEFGYMGFSLKV